MRASVILITKRAEPRVDEALKFLSQQTVLDFEYVLVDGYYFQRKEEMERLIREANPPFPVRYLPDKPTRWRGKRPALSNARNTAAIWVQSPYMIFWDDCVVKVPSNLVEGHLKWLEQGYAVAGNWFTHPDPPYGWEHRSKLTTRPTLVHGEWLYGGHHSVPMEGVLAVNGWDEMYDGEQGVDDCDFGIRLSRAGRKVLYDPSLYVEYDLKTHTLTQADHSFKLDWRKEGKPAEPKKRVLKDGKEHFSNEYLIQELADDRERYEPVGNNFTLARLRRLPEKHGFDVMKVHEALEKYVYQDPRDWRDGELIERM